LAKQLSYLDSVERAYVLLQCPFISIVLSVSTFYYSVYLSR